MSKPQHQPTNENREAITNLLACGWTCDMLCKLLKIGSKATLYKYYRNEIELGALQINAKISNTIVQQALAGDKTLLIFLAKARLGWKDRNVDDDNKNQQYEKEKAAEVVRLIKEMEKTVVGDVNKTMDPA